MRPTTDRRVVRSLVRAGALVLTVAPSAVAFLACSSSSAPTDPPCVANLSRSCAPTYATHTFDTVFSSILHPNCAVGTGTCHTADFKAGGLVLADETSAYSILLGTDGGAPLVIPKNPGCSTLIKRLESTDPSYHMPRGSSSLSAGDLCTIVQWIDDGATR